MAIYERIQILNLEMDSEDVSDFRILVDGTSFKYVTINSGVYDPGVMVWDHTLIPLLPPIPKGDWNKGHIARHPDTGTPYFAWYEKVMLPTIRNIWHSTHIDWRDLQRGQKLMSNVYTATFLKNTTRGESQGDDLVIKFARFPWELHHYDAETGIYKSIEGRGIGPKFLGHLSEDGRVIGFVLERIKDARHADPGDLEPCLDALGKLHQQGILHGDVCCNSAARGPASLYAKRKPSSSVSVLLTAETYVYRLTSAGTSQLKLYELASGESDPRLIRNRLTCTTWPVANRNASDSQQCEQA